SVDSRWARAPVLGNCNAPSGETLARTERRPSAPVRTRTPVGAGNAEVGSNASSRSFHPATDRAPLLLRSANPSDSRRRTSSRGSVSIACVALLHSTASTARSRSRLSAAQNIDTETYGSSHRPYGPLISAASVKMAAAPTTTPIHRSVDFLLPRPFGVT